MRGEKRKISMEKIDQNGNREIDGCRKAESETERKRVN